MRNPPCPPDIPLSIPSDDARGRSGVRPPFTTATTATTALNGRPSAAV